MLVRARSSQGGACVQRAAPLLGVRPQVLHEPAGLCADVRTSRATRRTHGDSAGRQVMCSVRFSTTGTQRRAACTSVQCRCRRARTCSGARRTAPLTACARAFADRVFASSKLQRLPIRLPRTSDNSANGSPDDIPNVSAHECAHRATYASTDRRADEHAHRSAHSSADQRPNHDCSISAADDIGACGGRHGHRRAGICNAVVCPDGDADGRLASARDIDRVTDPNADDIAVSVAVAVADDGADHGADYGVADDGAH